MQMLLAGDIGGTKTALAVYSREAGPMSPLAQAEFPSADFASLEDIGSAFVARMKIPVDEACFAIAGPVINGLARTTNLPWIVDERRLAISLNLRVARLVNDLEATATAVPVLKEDGFHPLNAGSAVPRTTIAVIAPGTGLGEGFLAWDGTNYRAHPSE